MFPIVSRRDPPTGHLLTSRLDAFLLSQTSKTLLPMSKTESIPVASRDSERDDIAAYTAKLNSVGHKAAQREREGTLQNTKSNVSREAGPNCNFHLFVCEWR